MGRQDMTTDLSPPPSGTGRSASRTWRLGQEVAGRVHSIVVRPELANPNTRAVALESETIPEMALSPRTVLRMPPLQVKTRVLL